MIGYMYILECSDGSFYTGSTNDLDRRLAQHQAGEGANHTKKRLPVKLVYCEEYQRIDEAYDREKQVQGWNRKKKEALIKGEYDQLPELAIAYRDKKVASGTSATDMTLHETLEGPVAEALEGPVAEALEANRMSLPEVLEGNDFRHPKATLS